MTTRRMLLQSGLAGLLGGALAGCGTGARREFTPTQPAMPMILAATPTLPVGPPEHELMETALRQVRAGDVRAAVATLATVHDPARRGQLGGRVVSVLAAQDPAVAASLVVQLPTGPGWTAALEQVARTWTQRDPADALGWAAALPDDAVGPVARSAVVEALVAADARATIERVRALPAGSRRDDLLVLTAAAWARRDATAAVGWLREQPQDDLRPRLTSGIGFAVAQSRPDRAIDLAELLPAGRERWLLFSAIAQTWVAVDPKAALAWAQQLPAGAGRDAAFAGVDTGFGVPASRRLRAGPGTSGSASRTRGGGAVVASMPDVNSPAFTAWLATQAPGLSADEAVLEYVRQRAAVEPGAVGPMIQALPGGTTRDRAMALYVDGLLLSSPGEAVRWVQSLPHTERTNELIEKTARRWLQTNPDAAASWLETTLLPPYLKEQLLREAGR